MDLTNRLTLIIMPIVNDLGYDLVQVKVFSDNGFRIQVMAEPLDGGKLSIKGCTVISRAISTAVELDTLIKEPFDLEVSSPGIDRPLVKKRDFERFAGLEAIVELDQPIDGRRRFKGILLGIEGDIVKIMMHKTEYYFPYSNILKSKLLMTNDMFSMHQKG